MENLFSWFNSDVGIGAALGYSIFGIVMVFLMLIILMVVINIMAAFFKKTQKKEKTSDQPAAVKPAEPEKKTAPGSAGGVKLYDVPDRTAAMIMAIVADKMGKPLNELRFISIREIKDDEV
ncbi:MAG: OadG family protein [Oscillospiraceae bacterium]|nr:OadG family protein [Oscillospiraceae bacterium]